MANTEFFAEAIKDNSSITWKDIFSESFAKHTKADREFAMQNGTLARQVPEANMLETWNRPWLWWPAAKWGLGLILILYVLYFVFALTVGGISNSFGNMMMIIPPMVVPLIIMIFLWELNIPQNISLMDMLAFFVVAGVINFGVNTLMFPLFPGQHASWAAAREEPAKLAAVLAILLYIQRGQKKKIYGLTGLVVGAVVGAAFSGIESVSYAINNSQTVGGMIFVQILRSVLALGGHFAFCIPYATAIALKAENGKITFRSIFNPMTLGALAFAIFTHALWNAGYGLGVQLVLMITSVFLLLYWVKKSLKQIVQICGTKTHYVRHDNVNIGIPMQNMVPGKLTVYCNTTSLQGTSWTTQGETLMIGRQQEMCRLCFDSTTPGVSRQHCKIFLSQGNWYIQDLNSTYGTYIRGKRLEPFGIAAIQPGDQVYLGSRKVWLSIQ